MIVYESQCLATDTQYCCCHCLGKRASVLLDQTFIFHVFDFYRKLDIQKLSNALFSVSDPKINRWGFCRSCLFSQECVCEPLCPQLLANRSLAVLTLWEDFEQFQQLFGCFALWHHSVPDFQEQCIFVWFCCWYKTVRNCCSYTPWPLSDRSMRGIPFSARYSLNFCSAWFLCRMNLTHACEL